MSTFFPQGELVLALWSPPRHFTDSPRRLCLQQTPDALNDAQRLAREWEAAHPR